MDIETTAARNQRLLADEAWKDATTEVRNDQLSAFQNSGPGDTGTREEAHAILRALAAIEAALLAPISAQKFALKKKGQHRGND